MIILSVKHFVFEHWQILAIVVLLLIVFTALHSLVDNIFFKPRREREAKRLKEIQDSIDLEKAQKSRIMEEERKKELRVLLNSLNANKEIHEAHFKILNDNWSNWNAEKIDSQIKVSVAKLEEERANAQRKVGFEARLESELAEDSISREAFSQLASRINRDDLTVLIRELESEIASYSRKKILVGKYGELDGTRISNGQYWLGMSEEQLIDSIGKPTLIEREVLKTKEKIIYIYGKKTTGDVFTFVNGKLEALKDR